MYWLPRQNTQYLKLTASLMSPIAAHTWDDAPVGQHGEGISRPIAANKTKRFTVLVRMERSAPVRVVTFAEDAAAAKKYMQSRWPNAAVEVLK